MKPVHSKRAAAESDAPEGFRAWAKRLVFSTAVFCAAGFQATLASPSPECEIWRTAWCIAIDNLIIEGTFSSQGSEWKMRFTWREPSREPLIILEPVSCFREKADAASVMKIERVALNEAAVRRVTLRLREDGTCDLTLILPDQRFSDATTILGLLKACPDADPQCRGRFFSDAVEKAWSKIAWPEK